MSLGKKIVILILVLSLILDGVFLLPPKTAKATISFEVVCMSGAGMVVGAGYSPCVSEASTLALAAKKTIFDASWWSWEKLQRYLEDQLWPSLRDFVAKRIMDYIVDQTIVWIQGGGKPKFVSDWSGFLKDAGNIAFDQLINDVNLARLCQPFGLQLKISLAGVPRFSQQISCTLDQVVKNINAFYDDFSQGGWIAYQELWQPNNNYYGVQLMVTDQLLLTTAAKTEAAKNEAISSGGFLGVKKCLEPIYTATESQFCDGGEDEFGNCPGGYLTKMSTVQTGCQKETIITPGEAVGEAVRNAIGSDSKWAANIQSWTSALVNALINRIIKEGIVGMKSLLAGGGSTGGNEADAYMPAGYQNSITQDFNNQKQQMISQLQSSLDENRAILNSKNLALSAVQMTQVYLQNLQARGCQTSITNLQSVQSELTRLNNETSKLEAAVAELNGLITRTNQAATPQGLLAVQSTYMAVFDRYNTVDFRTQISDGSARQAAQTEAQAKINERNLVQVDLSNCSNQPPSNATSTIGNATSTTGNSTSTSGQ